MAKALSSAARSISHFRFVTSARFSITGPATAKHAASMFGPDAPRNSRRRSSNVAYSPLAKRVSAMTVCAAPSISTSCSSVFVPPMSPAMMRMRARILRQPRQRLAPVLLPLRHVLLRRQLGVLHGDGRLAVTLRVEADLHARLVGGGEAERLRRGGLALLVLLLLRQPPERVEQLLDRHVERARDVRDVAARGLVHLAQA